MAAQIRPSILRPFLSANGHTSNTDGDVSLGDAREGVASAGIRVFRVTRLLGAAVVDEPASRPASFSLASFWSRWCADFEVNLPRYSVTLRMAPELLHQLPQHLGERVRAIVAEVERAGVPDGRGWLPVPPVFESLEKACVRVLGFGPLAEVGSPEALRLRVATLASGVAAHYASWVGNRPGGGAARLPPVRAQRGDPTRPALLHVPAASGLVYIC